MIAAIERILEEMEESSTSSGLAVADHIRTVASNGREYRTPEAIAEEASAVVQWAMTLDTALLDAVKEAKAALVGDSNDTEHDALVALVEALGEGQAPDCRCDEVSWYGEGHASSCPAQAWESKS